jgi:hypothetical protein
MTSLGLANQSKEKVAGHVHVFFSTFLCSSCFFLAFISLARRLRHGGIAQFEDGN